MAKKKPAMQVALEATEKKPAKKSTNITTKAQTVIDFLAKKGATTAAKAYDREKVWEACEVGMGVISTLKAKGLLVRVDHEDGKKLYHLTAEGKKLASK